MCGAIPPIQLNGVVLSYARDSLHDVVHRDKFTFTLNKFGEEIWGFDGGDDSSWGLLGCDAV